MDDPTNPLAAPLPGTLVNAKPEPKPAVLPQSGGTYRRNADGSLTQTVPPTKVPETAPLPVPDPKPSPRAPSATIAAPAATPASAAPAPATTEAPKE